EDVRERTNAACLDVIFRLVERGMQLSAIFGVQVVDRNQLHFGALGEVGSLVEDHSPILDVRLERHDKGIVAPPASTVHAARLLAAGPPTTGGNGRAGGGRARKRVRA